TFDICKNNEHVAKLSLMRNTYRLGETINGIIDFGKSFVPCFQVSMFLETTEQLEPGFAVSKPKRQLQRVTKKVVAESHRMTLNVRRMGVALSIPSGLTPEFKTSSFGLSYSLRLEFITSSSTSSVGSHADLYSRTGVVDPSFEHRFAGKDVEVEAFDCVIPLRVFPSRSG
ncbi:hypothetical protein HK097_006255, partial [Rhizophlyctis rosea]